MDFITNQITNSLNLNVFLIITESYLNEDKLYRL